MKKYILLFCTLFLVEILTAQIVNIPDANLKKYLVGKTNINTNSDTEIQVSEAVAYKGDIVVNKFSIDDVTGIETFVNLTVLDLTNNSITKLDVSKNIALIGLDCKGNKLTKLDVSKNIALEELDCRGNNLVTLDVGKNINLIYLDCSYTQLTKLDVSNNIGLNVIACGNNQLITLDVSKNFNLIYLNFQYNQFTTIDVSENIFLKSLTFYSNLLTTIDVSKNIDLEFLGCSDNKLSTLDVSKNFILRSLYCENNNLKQLNVKNGKNKFLTRFKAQNNPLLKCIEVDDPVNINSDWEKDATTIYSANCTVATNDLLASTAVSVFPNPVTEDCTIAFDFEHNYDVTVHIFDINGKVLQSNVFKNVSKNKENINVQHLPNGIYVLQTIIGDEQVSRKLVIAR